MNKIIASIMLIALCTISAVAQQPPNQNTYLDALKLLDALNSRTGNGESQTAYFFEILKKYGLDRSSAQNNPFLRGIFPNQVSAAGKVIEDNFTAQQITKTGTDPVNLQASIINGTASFMAGRFKEEALSASINYLFKAITEHPEEAKVTKAVFPKTFALIEELYARKSYYTADLVYIRQVAQYDLNLLPDNLITNIDDLLPKLAAEPELRDMLSVAHSIYHDGKKGWQVEKIITSVKDAKLTENGKIKKLVSLLDLISQALINVKGNEAVWINYNDLPAVESGELEFLKSRLFYGLLYEQLKKLDYMQPLLHQSGGYISDVTVLSKRMQSLIEVSVRLNQSADFIKIKKAQISSAADVIAYLRTISDVINGFATDINEMQIENFQLKLPEKALAVVPKYFDLADAVLQKDYQRIIATLLIEFGEYTRADKTYNKHLNFIAQMADLKSAADMEALMNSYALPIGGSSIKRQSKFNLSLNGYVGLTAGSETAYGTFANQSKANIGLTAPIGISSTFASGKLTAFISLIDLGSVVNQRLNNDTTSYTDFKFEYFFTPGIGLYYNFPKLPVTAGVHWNYIPNLRTIKYDTGTAIITETNRSVSRFNFSVLVDLPFFTLFNRAKDE